MALPEIRWDEPSLVTSRLDGAGRRLPQGMAIEESFLEAVRRTMRMIDLGSVVVHCPQLSIDLRETELREIFRCPGLADILPIDGDGANAVVLDGTCADSPPAPIFRGSVADACQHIWALPADARANGWVLSQSDSHTPAMLAARRPAPPALAAPRRPLRIFGLRRPI